MLLVLCNSTGQVGYSPKRSRRRRAMEVQRLRSEAAEQNISTFWRRRAASQIGHSTERDGA